jgi:Endonuclease/Exonuclease/phosphatase family
MSDTTNITPGVTPRLITFNCLSPHYARPEWFSGVLGKYLDEKYRFERLKTLMRSWFKVNFVIALQELSEDWVGHVREFCEANHYYLVHSTYSDGKMGVAIAYPINHYQIVTSDVFNAPGFARARVANMKNILDSELQDHAIDTETMKSMTRVVESFSNAENKDFENSLVSVLLRAIVKGVDSGIELLITTYHMPCRFTEPIYMACQAREMLSHQSDLLTLYSDVDSIDRQSMGLSAPSQIVPIVMADCNIDPEKGAYRVLTGGDDALITDIGRAYAGVGADFNSHRQMRSAFALATGDEPTFTNVKLRDPNDPNSTDFINTIDYILVPDGTAIKSVQLGLTPKDGEPIGAYPNAICPSDHLPLSASLIIK